MNYTNMTDQDLLVSWHFIGEVTLPPPQAVEPHRAILLAESHGTSWKHFCFHGMFIMWHKPQNL